jgi:hypothetical protein
MIMRILTMAAGRVLRAAGVRPPCALCCLKHVSQARALLLEALKGYPHFFWFALGHLAEAEDEIVASRRDLADIIREERKKLERDPAYVIDFEKLVRDLSVALSLDPTEFLTEGKRS